MTHHGRRSIRDSGDNLAGGDPNAHPQGFGPWRMGDSFWPASESYVQRFVATWSVNEGFGYIAQQVGTEQASTLYRLLMIVEETNRFSHLLGSGVSKFRMQVFKRTIKQART